jgi:hypothetical protein
LLKELKQGASALRRYKAESILDRREHLARSPTEPECLPAAARRFGDQAITGYVVVKAWTALAEHAEEGAAPLGCIHA